MNGAWARDDQVDLASAAVIGMEAPIRWCQPEKGMMQLERFIVPAGEAGLIVPRVAWVLRDSCSQAAGWRREDLGSLRAAANLSLVSASRPALGRTCPFAIAPKTRGRTRRGGTFFILLSYLWYDCRTWHAWRDPAPGAGAPPVHTAKEKCNTMNTQDIVRAATSMKPEGERAWPG